MSDFTHNSENLSDGKPWFAEKAPEDDIILSTRVRLCRNLADFPFPGKFQNDDGERIRNLIFDAFSEKSLENRFHMINFSELDPLGILLLKERCVISKKCDAVIMSNDGASSCTVNTSDHLRICSFSSGLNLEKAANTAQQIDEALQNKLQFAASFQFGYLSSNFKDSGSGMKVSIRCHIPSIVLSRKFELITKECKKNNFSIRQVVNTKNPDFITSIFEISTTNSSVASKNNTEISLLTEMLSFCNFIIKTERKIQEEFADNEPTTILNLVRRNWAKAMYSTLIEEDEAFDFVSAMKFGIHTGIISGITDETLNSLIYSTRNAHLEYLRKNYEFSFEKDLLGNTNLQLQRLRAIVVQEAFENIKFNR